MGGASAAQVLDAVRKAALAAGFEADDVSPNTISLSGKTRPGWAIALAGLLLIPTLGLSLFLLKVRTKGKGTASLTYGVGGMHLVLSGRIPDYLPSVIDHLLGEQQPAFDRFSRQATAYQQHPQQMTAPAPMSFAPAPLQRAEPIAGGSLPAWAAEDEHLDVNSTIARPRRIDLTGGAPVLRFDTGQAVSVRGFALIGRAPTADATDPQAQLLPIADPKLSVSKTHLAVGVDDGGFWICDRHSTNGTSVTGVDGKKVTCTPGTPHYVDSGSIVHMGDRSFSVVLAGTSVGQPR